MARQCETHRLPSILHVEISHREKPWPAELCCVYDSDESGFSALPHQAGWKHVGGFGSFDATALTSFQSPNENLSEKGSAHAGKGQIPFRIGSALGMSLHYCKRGRICRSFLAPQHLSAESW